MLVDYLVVGSGLTGATIARHLHDHGHKVLVLERRPHLGGNVHDHVHPSGVRIHTYGPHYFRTSSQRVWDYVQRFADFYRYEAALMSWVDGAFEAWPIRMDYIERTCGRAWSPDFRGTPRNFEEASLAIMPRGVYEKFVKGYTEKQWGTSCRALSAELAGRFEVSTDGDRRLKKSTYQGIPREGYAAFMARMLSGIPAILNIDYLRERAQFEVRRQTIYTGAIDEFFDFDLGRLVYRGQRRVHEFLPDVAWAQPAGQVNYPLVEHGPHIRILEWKHMMERSCAEGISGTVLTRETPFTPSDPREYEYPFPDSLNQLLYRRYEERTRAADRVIFCGRLGEYRYLDMDQAIGRAMKIVERLLDPGGGADGANLVQAT